MLLVAFEITPNPCDTVLTLGYMYMYMYMYLIFTQTVELHVSPQVVKTLSSLEFYKHLWGSIHHVGNYSSTTNVRFIVQYLTIP